ncbi:MAG: tetratricopeptide repeat protein, partial [candidate division KSB1 bacterium]|nr:tetratricopeptide repeat protein [candidate division KSB1 bacterium]
AGTLFQSSVMLRDPEGIRRMRAADSLLAEGRELEAAAELEAVLRFDSSLVDVRHTLAQIYIWNEQLPQAIRHYEAILRAVPDDTASWRTLSDLYFWTNRERDGIWALERLASLRPEDVELQRRLAQLCSWNGLYHDAVEHLKVLMRSNPRDTALVRALKDNLFLAGQPKLALQVYRYLLGLAPERYDWWLDYARNLAWNDQLRQSVQAYLRLRQAGALSDSTFHEFVDVLIWAGEQGKAIQELRAWLTNHPDDAWSQWKLAQLLDWNEGSTTEMRQVLSALLRQRPDYTPAIKLYRRVSGLPGPQARAEWVHVTDSNKLVSHTASAQATLPLQTRALVSASSAYRNLAQNYPDTSAVAWGKSASAGICLFPTVGWMFEARVSAARYQDGWTPFGWDARSLFRIGPRFSWEVGYASGECLESPFALKLHLWERCWTAALQYEVHPGLSLTSWARRSRFSDGNVYVAAFLTGAWTVRPFRPGLRLTSHLGAEHCQHQYPRSIPYWTPDRLQHRSLGVEVDHLVRRWLGLSGGLAVFHSSGYPVSVNLRGSATFHLSPRHVLLFEYFEFGSRAYHSSTICCRFSAEW